MEHDVLFHRFLPPPPAVAAAGEALANQKLRSSAGQSEAGTGIGTTGAVTAYHTKPPIVPYFILNSVLFNSMFLGRKFE